MKDAPQYTGGAVMSLLREVLTLAVDTLWPRCLLCGRRRRLLSDPDRALQGHHGCEVLVR